MTVFVISDTHFGHPYVASIRGFSDWMAHDEWLVERWNSVVGKRDVVWHVGDVAMRRGGLKSLPLLNGIKHLVLGNHDCWRVSVYERYFNKVRGIQIIRKQWVLSHLPLHPAQMEFRYARCVCVHGHTHHGSPRLYGPRYFNACVDVSGPVPRPLEEIKEEKDGPGQDQGNLREVLGQEAERPDGEAL